MTKLSFKRLIIGFIAALATLGSQDAFAQNGNGCGLTGSATAAATIQYDPFSTNDLSEVTIPLTLTRFVGTGGKKTQFVYFILERPSQSPDYKVFFTNGSTTSNVVYTPTGHPNLPTMNSNDPGQIYYNFGGNQPDQVTFNVKVTVPAGADLSAGGNITFDIVYKCTGTGGMDSVVESTRLAQAVTINVNVLSALQASYGGEVLDFGEVGNKSNTDVQGSPTTYTRKGTIRVRSSGAYEIRMNSTNNYRLTYPNGGDATNVSKSLTYTAKLVGNAPSDTRVGVSGSTASQPDIVKNCVRAGVIGGQTLPLEVTLTEGGNTKLPSPGYADTLNVTVTPLVAIGTSACP